MATEPLIAGRKPCFLPLAAEIQAGRGSPAAVSRKVVITIRCQRVGRRRKEVARAHGPEGCARGWALSVGCSVPGLRSLVSSQVREVSSAIQGLKGLNSLVIRLSAGARMQARKGYLTYACAAHK